MGKIYQNELAALLVEKCELEQKKAQLFVTAFVKTIQKGLENDRMVKIKGLGTFKVVDVGTRESINVNTGERVVIEGHSKLSFLPDNAMKELVNRPFSQFETVVLNEGVDFSDIDSRVVEKEPLMPSKEEDENVAITLERKDEMIEIASEEVEEKEAFATEVEPAKAEELIVIEESVKEEEPVEEEEPVVIEKSMKEEDTIAVEKPKEEVPQSVPFVDELEEESPENLDLEDEYTTSDRSCWWKYLLVSFLCLAVGFGGGFFVGKQSTEGPASQVASLQVTAVPDQQKAKAQEAKTSVEASQVQKNTMDAVLTESASEDNKTDAISPKPSQEEPTTGDEPVWEKYNNMDRRTHDGYYYIMGLDRMEKARQGDTPTRIAKRVFGASEMACYIEVFNGFDSQTVLEEGAEVKVPKVEPKKTVRKRLKQHNNQ